MESLNARTPAEKANDAVAERLHQSGEMMSETTSSGTSARFRRAFERELERTYCRVVRARAIVERFSEIVDAMDAKLAALQGADDNEPGSIDLLASKLDWSPAQRDLVWSIVACSIDPRITPHLETIGGAHARRGLSLTAYAQLARLDDCSAAALARWLAPSNPLIACGLVSATEAASPAARAYVATDHLVSFLADELRDVHPLRLIRTDRPLLHDPRQAEVLDEISAAFERSTSPVIVIEGPIGSGRATACACASGRELVILDCDRVSSKTFADALVALQREWLLRGAVPVLANVDHLLGEDANDVRCIVGDFVDHFEGPVITTVTISGAELGARKPVMRVRWDVPDAEVRARLWTAACMSVDAAIDGDISSLAFRYRVGPAAINQAVTSAVVMASTKRIGPTELAVGLRHNIAERLGTLARRIDVNQSWDDLVIAGDTSDQISALIGRIRNAHHVLDTWGYRTKIARGAGVAALFSGPPGTGKTMVAGLIARELDLELYQVDLSKVVSKWIGETEKNLARIFDAAEEGHALLLFDEADAMFGQRSSEMKTSTDRYANLEVNYLLQRVEAFGGITILTTNL
jgi:hypothetical protein